MTRALALVAAVLLTAPAAFAQPPAATATATATSTPTPTPTTTSTTTSTPTPTSTPTSTATAAQATPPGGPRVLHLDEAVRLARERQPRLRQARANTRAAAARADEARAPLLPQLTGTAAFQDATSNFVARPGSLPSAVASREERTSWSPSEFWSFGATLSQLVWDFQQTSGRWRAARESAAAQRETERTSSASVLLSVRSAFFTARAAKDLVAVARETLANQDAHLKQVQAFVEVGTRPEIDLAQARAARANAQVQLVNAENGYATAKAQLDQAMGVEGPGDYDVGDDALPPLPGEDEPLEPLLAEAIAARPELASLERQKRAQEATVGASRGGYFPSLGVSTGLTGAGPYPDQTVPNWNVQATLTWNLFDGWRTRALVQEARANLDAADAQLASFRQQVRVEVEQARLGVRAAKATLDAAADALASAREQLRLAEGRYQAGAGSIIELGDAQVAATFAAAQRVQAEYSVASARARLITALGRDAEPR